MNTDNLLLNGLFYSPVIALNSGANAQKLSRKVITLDDYFELVEKDIGTSEMDDYLIEVASNLPDLRAD